MQAADDVKFGGAFAHALFRALINFFERDTYRRRERSDRGRNAHSLQCATQTLVGLMWRLTLK